MKRNLLYTFFLFILASGTITAQTTIWSSDLESLSGFAFQDLDNDGNSFFNYTDGTYVGFAPGRYLGSLSQNLTPDNLVITPVFAIHGSANNISLSLKVASSSETDYQETFGIYIQENGVGGPTDNLLHQETLTNGGPDSYSTINVTIPNSYAGKSVKIVVRHFNTNNEFFFMIDDYLVESQDTLSLNDTIFESLSFYPNPVNDRLNFRTVQPITKIQIFNLLGQEVMTFDGTNLNLDSVVLTSLRPGSYLIKIFIDRTSQVYRLVKK